MKNRAFLPLSVLLLAGSGYAQPAAPATQPARPAAAGLAPDRAARIDQLLNRYVEENRIPGAVALVLRDGKPVYEKAFGWADKEAGRKMTATTLFRIASQTKAFTSTAVLQLVEEGKIGIAQRVGDFIPTFKQTTVLARDAAAAGPVPARRPITIADLLTHTAGISYGTEPHVA